MSDFTIAPLVTSMKLMKSYSYSYESRGILVKLASTADCIHLVDYATKIGKSVCPRGSGYSYADMAMNRDNIIACTRDMNKVISWDSSSGVMIVEPGVTFSDVFKLALILNWTLPSCPGGMAVTIGGAVSNNVHGKDCVNNGNFGRQVVELKLLTASGEILTLSKDSNSDLFHAVIGGMGLLGLILEVTLQLKRVPSPFVEVTTVVTSSIDESIDVLEHVRHSADFSVAWVDAFAQQSNLGRGYVTYSRWIDHDRPVCRQKLEQSLTVATRIAHVIPANLFWKCGKPFFYPSFLKRANSLLYAKKKLMRNTTLVMLFTDYNFMHNKIPGINSVYKPHGFLEFEPLVPRENGKRHLRELLLLGKKYAGESLLCAVKMHRQDDFLMSYSQDGYSIGIDIQVKGRTQRAISNYARSVYNYTRECGGKVYLAKDQLLDHENCARMYPQYEKFLQIKAKVDGANLFQSDMYRRLFVSSEI